MKKKRYKQKVKQKVKQKTERPKRIRYYDMRLVWLTIGLASAYIGIRFLISIRFGVPFIYSIGQVSPHSEELLDFESWLNLFELFSGMLILCFFDEEPPRNGVYRTENIPGALTLMNLVVMFLPIIIWIGIIWVWVGYITFMLLLSFYIGRYVGFGLPMGKEQIKHMLGAATDMNVNSQIGMIHFPRKSVIVFISILYITLFGFLCYLYSRL